LYRTRDCLRTAANTALLGMARLLDRVDVMIMMLGNEEVVVIQIPRGSHAVARRLGIDLIDIAGTAVTNRLRAASIADHMSRSIQKKFNQSEIVVGS
jgi:hypothetical protein